MFGVSVGALALSNEGIPPEPLGLFEMGARKAF